jgi:hypothetical protein
MAHSSNRDRIARAAEEAELTAQEKAVKKPKAKTTGAKRAATPERVKRVWEVYGSTGIALASFGYADKEAAEQKAAAMSKSTGRPHKLRAARVPME